ncbi:MAG: GNAT family N-acetyltransferase [Rhodobacter sp.]|nr:GNAT family N-acetyltransferase [Rhodobacter sp.]
MILRRAGPDEDWAALLALLQQSFAYMTPLMGYRPRVATMTPQDIADRAAAGTAWIAEADGALVACLFARPSRDIPDALFLHMLAVAEPARGQGLARRLMALAEAEACAQGIPQLTLDTGTALTDLCATYLRWGFHVTADDGETVTFVKSLAPTALEGDRI